MCCGSTDRPGSFPLSLKRLLYSAGGRNRAFRRQFRLQTSSCQETSLGESTRVTSLRAAWEVAAACTGSQSGCRRSSRGGPDLWSRSRRGCGRVARPGTGRPPRCMPIVPACGRHAGQEGQNLVGNPALDQPIEVRRPLMLSRSVNTPNSHSRSWSSVFWTGCVRGPAATHFAPVAALLAQFGDLVREHATGPDEAELAHACQRDG